MDFEDPVSSYITLAQVVADAPKKGIVIGKVVKTLDPHSSLETESEESNENDQTDESEEELDDSTQSNEESEESEDKEKQENAITFERQNFDERLSSVLSDLYYYKPFAFGGQQHINQPYSLFIKNEDELVSCGFLDELNIDTLLQHCKVSPFGDLKTLTTVVDPTIRTAFEIEADRLIWKQHWSKKDIECGWTVTTPEWFDSTLDTLQRQFGDNTLRLIPYKLNVYKPGGFFKAHVDTPIDGERMIGSLVVCLPTRFEGGELIVSHGDTQFVANFDYVNSDTLTWAAFYSDRIHEVKPVKSGYRITLTFSICTGDSPNTRYVYGRGKILSRAPRLKNQIDEPLSRLVSLLKDVKNKKLGILLSYKYTFKGLSAEILKGVDRNIYECLMNQGFDCTLLPVVRHYYHCYGCDGVDDVIESNVIRFTREDVNYLMGMGAKPVILDTDIPFYEVATGNLLSHSHEQGAEHTGNSASPSETDNLYFSAALIISL